ncbi:MAG: ribonuclease H-like domain-containing protein [Pirellulaceae bacterium]|nr:ribonuclease H-like domain-containing protein [Pirellulaceae bacterium]
MTAIAFDIETGPLPLDRLQFILPAFDSSSLGPPPGDFDPASVKTGNIKDQAKIEAKIADARNAHALAVQRYQQQTASAEPAYWADQQAKAALSAITGQVLAIGYCGEKVLIDCVGDSVREDQLIRRFWAQFIKARDQGRHLVGWNIEGFDLPFLCQRSAILGIRVPDRVFSDAGWLDSTFVDLMRRWCRPARAMVKLDTVARAIGDNGKTFDRDGNKIGGDQFADLFFNDPDLAIEYLKNDLNMVVSVGSRLGLEFTSRG